MRDSTIASFKAEAKALGLPELDCESLGLLALKVWYTAYKAGYKSGSDDYIDYYRSPPPPQP